MQKGVFDHVWSRFSWLTNCQHDASLVLCWCFAQLALQNTTDVDMKSMFGLAVSKSNTSDVFRSVVRLGPVTRCRRVDRDGVYMSRGGHRVSSLISPSSVCWVFLLSFMLVYVGVCLSTSDRDFACPSMAPCLSVCLWHRVCLSVCLSVCCLWLSVTVLLCHIYRVAQ